MRNHQINPQVIHISRLKNQIRLFCYIQAMRGLTLLDAKIISLKDLAKKIFGKNNDEMKKPLKRLKR